jgi:hypothetical protein
LNNNSKENGLLKQLVERGFLKMEKKISFGAGTPSIS